MAIIDKRYCPRCGREMVVTNRKIGGAQSFDIHSGQKMRGFGLDKEYPESEIAGVLRCPSWRCRLLNYSWGSCYVDYVVLKTGEIVEDLYHAI